MKFIIDEEIDLKQNDILNTKVYAKTLKSAIKNSPVDKSFTIGLFGEWGSGKSSIIKTVDNELQKDKKENIKFIIYDAWKYANDSFRRMFLLKVQETLKFERTSLMNSFYLNESEDVEIKKKLNKTNLLIIGILMLVGIITINFIPTESENWKFSLSIFISFLGLITTILLKAFDEFKVNIQKPHLFAPEQFEECFFEMISKSMKKYSPIEKAYQWVQGNRFVKDIDKLIVVIDNIDRCNKELAYELLTDTKSFLGKTKNVIFIIPVDDEALKKHILSSNANNKEAEEFLRKYFNTTIRIKPFKTIDLFDFANKLNLKYSLSFNPDTIDIIAKEYATNPRRIIQFFNNLLVELTNFENNFNKEFAEKYESLICKLLIIREEWPQFYKLISDKPHLINDNSEEKDKLLEKYKDFSIFLKNTKAISKGINITVYEKLLSNNNAFKELDDELLNIINNQNFEEIIKKIEQDSKKTQIVNYAIEGLKNGIKSKRYHTLTVRMFNLLIFINNISELSIYENHRIQNLIEDELVNFFDKVDINSELISYIDNLNGQKIIYLIEFIRTLIKEGYQKEEDVSEFISKLLITIISESKSTNLISELKEPFVKYFKSQEISLSKLINGNKVPYIFTDDLFDYLLSELKTLDIDSNVYNDIIFIVNNNIELSDDYNEKILEKLNSIYPNFTNKNKQELLKIIELSLPLISPLIYSQKGNKKQLELFLNKFFSNRTVANRNTNLITETINNSDEIKILVDFLNKIYIIAIGSIASLKNHFNQIAISNVTNRSIINESFVVLKENQKFNLLPLFDIILTDNVYESNTFKLLKHIFTYKKNNEYILPNDKLKSKTVEMFNLVFSGNEKANEIILFFESLTNDERIKEILSDIISGRTKEEILKLSPKLLKFSFDKITENDNIFEYQNDIEILKAIAESGEKKHLSKLTKVIVSKLQKEETIDDALAILEVSKTFNNRDGKNIITNLENILDNDIYKKRAGNIINKLKNNDTTTMAISNGG